MTPVSKRLLALGIFSLALLRGWSATLTVGPSRSAQWSTVQEALAAASPSEPLTLELEAGRYFGPIVIDRPNVTLRGRGPATVLTGNLGQAMPGVEGRPLEWRGASTLLLTPKASGCVVENLTVENTYGKGMQAQALSIEADKVIVRLCLILGWQDTIRLEAGRHYFDRCYISGHVDFIYGAATAYFDQCELFCRESGYIVAPATPADAVGFVFHRCRVTSPYGDAPTYLGRPWREHPQAVFIDCELGACVRPEGWKEWRVPAELVRFAEYGSRGPGAEKAARVAWAKTQPGPAPEAFTLKSVFVDWIP